VKQTVERIKMLFAVNTPGSLWNIVLDGVLILRIVGEKKVKKILHIVDPLAYTSQEWLKLETPASDVCAVHSMQPLPNYFGLLLTMING